MNDEAYDRKLNITTTGIVDSSADNVHYNRYEATPYDVLDKFFDEYRLSRKDRVVDFGCGRGRVAFYLHNRFHVQVTGIEVVESTYLIALENKEAYFRSRRHAEPLVNFYFCAAENYIIDSLDNRFYFFNPFSINVFRTVVGNILSSVREYSRSADIILYYPRPEYELFLKKSTPFRLVKEVKMPDTDDIYDKFLVYRY